MWREPRSLVVRIDEDLKQHKGCKGESEEDLVGTKQRDALVFSAASKTAFQVQPMAERQFAHNELINLRIYAVIVLLALKLLGKLEKARAGDLAGT